MDGRDAVWKWAVKPKAAGKQTLVLTVVSLLDHGQALELLTRFINVIVPPATLTRLPLPTAATGFGRKVEEAVVKDPAKASDFFVSVVKVLTAVAGAVAGIWGWLKLRQSNRGASPLPPIDN